MATQTRRPRLGADFGPLEDRSVPAQFGIPWPDTGHLTLSFAPDGTPTPAGPSQSTATFAAAPGWQRETLRAFQAWAVHTNMNIGVVADGGQPTAAPGAVQGDSRFGDVRIAAAPIAGDNEVAFAAPFAWAGSTVAGDVLFDSGRPFRVGNVAGGYDVFTVAAHEAGHAFGLDHSADAGSVLNETYSYRTGLSAGDVARVRALYGARTPDAYDAAASNGTAAGAVAVPRVAGSTSQYLAVGDVTTAADVDYYKITVPVGTASLVGRLKVSGESLLLARYTVTNLLGQVVATGAAADPLTNDLTFRIDGPLPATYLVRVEGATPDVFGIGGYRLVLDTTSLAAPLLAALPQRLQPALDAGTNDTLGQSTRLEPKTQADARFDAVFLGAIETPTDADYYTVRTLTGNSPVTLNLLAWGTDASPVLPAIHVYDDAGRPLAHQVLANDSGVVSVRVAGVSPNRDYFVQVLARAPGQVGEYYLGADFNTSAAPPAGGLATGTLSAGSAAAAGTFTVVRSAVYQFGIGASLTAPAAPAAGLGGVTLDVVDAGGNTVLSLTADGNQTAVTRVQYLPLGTYTLRYRYWVSGTVPLRYNAVLHLLTDPIGPRRTETAGSNPPPPPPDGYTYDGPSDTQPTGLPPSY